MKSRRQFLQWTAGIGLGIVAFGAIHGCTTATRETTRNKGDGVLTADQALQELKEGNQRYIDMKLTHPDQTLERRTDVAKGQHPFAVIVGCSDSRVSPEIVFDQGLGDLFVIRVAGNIVDDEVLGSIEFAVEEIGLPLIVVLGHERCGAVSAAVDAVLKGSTAPGHINSLVEAIKPAVLQVKDQPGDLLDNAVRANVERVVEQLSSSEPILRESVAAGKVRLVGARYDLDTGVVEFIPPV